MRHLYCHSKYCLNNEFIWTECSIWHELVNSAFVFMQVWNDVGIVRQYNSEEENSIDIEFHDTSVHHAMHITNNFNYTMASLSTEAVLLASESDVDSAR